MTTMYRAGIIGCGSIAHAHALGYKALADRVELVAIADPVPAALEEFGARHGVEKQYADARQMLDEEALDIVSIATWHKLHAPLTIAACARRPQVVLCEKPMAVNLGDCDEMLIAAKRNNVKLAIAHQRRFNATWNEARRLVSEGAIGLPLHIIAKGGQGLLNDCSHYLDMMRYVLDANAIWVMGNVERKTDRLERGVRIEDRSHGVIQFDNNCLGLLLQELQDRPYPGRTFHGQGGLIQGSDGTIEYDEKTIRLLNGSSAGWEERDVDGEDASIGQARELVQWLDGDIDMHRGEGHNGRAAIEMIMAIYESARRHEVVQLPLRTMGSPLDEMIDTGDLPVERPGAYDIRSFLLRGEQMRDLPEQ
jgi:UDP-N-acetyl-2-amino-2-deoxyglucuronate dehydrogenase